MQLGTQYYRPPFPNQQYWEDDLRAMADAGLNTAQFWVLWSWVEAKPGTYRFDDYDRLVELAGKNGLKVVLSAIAEVQPHWIHRLIPGSELVNQFGHKVVSTNRNECHFGLSPGGCTDHPEVWSRMQEFFRAVVGRYKEAPNLFGWDVWNELRWNVHAQGLVCFCPHTLAAFRNWLRAKYGDLDALNAAWQRRYDSWDDVLPGRAHQRPFTEMMAFHHFITERANAHARNRFELVKSLDPAHPATVHGAQPCIYETGWQGDASGETCTPLGRGNDWNFAEHIEGVGCSSFPKWNNWDWKDYAARMEIIRSAAGSKRLWLSELQGGRAQWGSQLLLEVPADDQQQWIYNGLAVGAEAVLFWCWRDEVFTVEAGGFGITGQDGRAEERVGALRETGRLIRENAGLLSAYRPAQPAAGVFFSPQSYYQRWCTDGNAGASMNAFLGYGRALLERNIPFEAVEERHLDVLSRLKVLFLPRVSVLEPETSERLLQFVRDGGTLLVEAETGSFDSRGLYRYAPDRFIAKAVGAAEVGKRSNDTAERLIQATVGGETFMLKTEQLLTPWRLAAGGSAWATHPDGALLAEQPYGKGRLILVGTQLGEAYQANASPGFSALLERIVRDAGAEPGVEILGPAAQAGTVFARHGKADGNSVIFVFGSAGVESVRLGLSAEIAGAGRFRDLLSEREVVFARTGGRLEADVDLTRWRMAMLVEMKCGV